MEDSQTPPSAQPLASADPWNAVAIGYEEATRPFLEKFSARGLERLQATGTFGSQCRLLDVACGPGTTSLLCAELVAHIDAVDFSPDMLQVFTEQLETKNLGNVRLHLADGQALPFEDQSFDCAVSMFGLMFFPDRVRGMKELKRVLRPGGRALISSWAPVTRSSAMMALFDGVRAIDPTRPEPQADVSSLENPEVFKRELEEAGFEGVEIVEVEETIDFESPEAFWDKMARGAVPLVMMKKRLGEELFEEKSKQARAELKKSLGDRRTLSSVAYLAFANSPS